TYYCWLYYGASYIF
nr:immunoglobulin light chain junction region [Macaca mulatta]MOX28984.1 immunoglobulin light chain junction region [Macaca mulatta]MOX29667.1 immunoglobulin light chain junction region [Macaca mulatta]MOX29804.1 immunoglobulin light chain junction region [Macaca mulatta]MOX29966.1 immunoglobulin light chain junction region [Macaca mulatta]